MGNQVITATLEIKDAPDIREGARRFLLDCPHGETTLLWAPSEGGLRIDESDLTELAVLRHESAERCGCAAALWKRMGGGPL